MITRARYFQSLKTEYSKDRYIECLARLLAFVAYSVKASLNIGLMEPEVELIKSLMFPHDLPLTEKTSVLPLSVDAIAALLSSLFFRPYLINYNRWEDPVFIYWSCLGVEKQDQFKSPRFMTQALAALKYAVRLTVLYFSMQSSDNTE